MAKGLAVEEATKAHPRRLPRLSSLILPLVVMALLAYPFVFTLPFQRNLMILVFLYAALGQAWNILGGYAGQSSLGHAAFFGVSAYTSSLLLIKFGIVPWVGMLAGGLVAVVLSMLIGYPSFRLKGHYFVIATIVLAEIVNVLFTNWPYAGGAEGLFLPLLPEGPVNFEFHSSKVPYYYIIFAILAVVTWVVFLIERSKLGYYFRAIREDPDAARSLGIDITRYKLIAMALSAFFTGVCGTFYAQFVLFLEPNNSLHFMLSVLIMLIPVFGGSGTLWGPILGAFILIPLSEFTRIYLSGAGRAIDLMLYGLLIMLVAIFEPRGLWAVVQRFRSGEGLKWRFWKS
jgi:branched-chain amino acid transport system permease protein